MAWSLKYKILVGAVLLISYFSLCNPLDEITCDFDLQNIERIIRYLPQDCQLAWAAQGELAQMYKREAIMFNTFYERLLNYELKYMKPHIKHYARYFQRWPFEGWLRLGIYINASLNSCKKIGDAKVWLGCTMMRRKYMIDAVPELYSYFL